jgi:RNA polymerase sigma-70 factor (ECF subfamily)
MSRGIIAAPHLFEPETALTCDRLRHLSDPSMAERLTAEILNTQVPRLRRYARALTGNRDAADDLTQDTLERAWAKRALWRMRPDLADNGLRAWLFAVMHNVYINNLKKTPMAESLDLLDDGVEPEALRPASAETNAVIGDIRSALLQLPAEQRAVVLLVGLEQLSYVEAAQALGVPIGTVMSRLSRGRDRLRLLLDGGQPSNGLRRVK